MKIKCRQCGKIAEIKKDIICSECIEDNKKDHDKIQKLIDKGHTLHCAERIVWGDGNCECVFIERDKEGKIIQ